MDIHSLVGLLDSRVRSQRITKDGQHQPRAHFFTDFARDFLEQRVLMPLKTACQGRAGGLVRSITHPMAGKFVLMQIKDAAFNRHGL